jgi:hypothetical protein
MPMPLVKPMIATKSLEAQDGAHGGARQRRCDQHAKPPWPTTVHTGNHQAGVDAHQLAASRSLKVATTALP